MKLKVFTGSLVGLLGVPYALLIGGVPDKNQPVPGSLANPIDNACVPVSAANITSYWDDVMGHLNALGVNAGLNADTAADYLYYFFDTDNAGDPAANNGTSLPAAQGTYTMDIIPGAKNFIRWDAGHPFGTPPPVLPSGKMGYDWHFDMDQVAGFEYHAAEIDSGHPNLIVFSYWNPVPTGDTLLDATTGEVIHFYTWGTALPGSADPEESWNDQTGDASIGHAVTGVGYLRQYDPDGLAGILPDTNWVITHDNWSSTQKNVALPWGNWRATARIHPGFPGQPFTGSYISKVPDNPQPPAGTLGCAVDNFCAPVSLFNTLEYWEAVQNHPNAALVAGGLPAGEAADNIGFFMATNGNAVPTCGSAARFNPNIAGTLTADILPGAREFIRWDAANRFPAEPPFFVSMMGYNWTLALDTSVGFDFFKSQIDSGLVALVGFDYWNPQNSGVRIVDSVSQDTFEVYQQGTAISTSLTNDPQNPLEVWPCADNNGGCPRGAVVGHIVTGVGYAENFDPDGAGPLPASDWIICHDNWKTTGQHVMIDWTRWNSTISLNPNSPPLIINAMDTVTVQAGESNSWQAQVTDLEGDMLTYNFDLPAGGSLPDWIIVQNDSELVVSPSESDSTLDVRIIVADGHGGSDTALINMEVVYNSPPTITNIIDSLVLVPGDSLRWIARAVDSEGDSISFIWALSGGYPLPGYMTVTQDSILDITPGMPDTSVAIDLEANDGKGGRDFFRLWVTIEPPVKSTKVQTSRFTFAVKGVGVVYQAADLKETRLDIFNISGQKVRSFAPQFYILWDGADNSGVTVPAGLYIMRAVTDDVVVVRKFVVNLQSF